MRRRKTRVYLSGGMEYAKQEGIAWRSELEAWFRNELGQTVFNPNSESEKYLRRKPQKVDIRRLKSQDIARFSKVLNGIVDLDSREIAYRSDYVVCYWDQSAQRGAGTKGELTIARFFRKPVYMVTKIKHENIPGWILGCSTRIFSSFAELKKFLLRKYKDSTPPGPIRKRSTTWKTK